MKALADLNMDISKTIAVRHIYLIKDYETPYDRLVALKKFLCLRDASRRRKLADKYIALRLFHELRRRSNNGCPTGYKLQLRANRSGCLRQKAIV
jgi:hypothetical protein